jgi:antitoxin component of MazEF toxin-antitoxin module
MQVAKWGDSLALRLRGRGAVLEGRDHIEVRIVGDREVEIGPDTRRQAALDSLEALTRPLPEGFRFSRSEVEDRSDRGR